MNNKKKPLTSEEIQKLFSERIDDPRIQKLGDCLCAIYEGLEKLAQMPNGPEVIRGAIKTSKDAAALDKTLRQFADGNFSLSKSKVLHFPSKFSQHSSTSSPPPSPNIYVPPTDQSTPSTYREAA